MFARNFLLGSIIADVVFRIFFHSTGIGLLGCAIITVAVLSARNAR